MDAAAATGTWTVVPYGKCDYVVSARVEFQSQPVGGPPLVEMATAAQLRSAGAASRELARHLARMQASATFWSFPQHTGQPGPNYVVQVEAVPAGQGRHGHTVLMDVLRRMAASSAPARKSRRRRNQG